ncbi:MAG: AraC family transcriptional regulator [Roseburia sp.]|nr:AraC family transcriptional regulator [Roseburia sp.]MCM1098996.1 AraC family transcriptional regulator [Ruminococcus flavefaciens]
MNNKDPVFRSLAIIEENIQKKLTVESLAHSIHLSGSRYQRLFREVTGDSVMNYVTRRRLALAAADLAETNESILDIALKCGYDSHEAFTRSFRAHMGVSPREYRKHRLSVCPAKNRKEKYPMTYSKKIDEIIRNMNRLIVRIRDTAEYTRKNRDAAPDAAAFYSAFWDLIAADADDIADELSAIMSRITDIPQHPAFLPQGRNPEAGTPAERGAKKFF